VLCSSGGAVGCSSGGAVGCTGDVAGFQLHGGVQAAVRPTEGRHDVCSSHEDEGSAAITWPRQVVVCIARTRFGQCSTGKLPEHRLGWAVHVHMAWF
jgi:hypothetical protein